MTYEDVEILLVEDNPRDVELMLRALRRSGVANRIVNLVDGQAALDYLFAEGDWSGRDVADHPRVVFLDLKLPKVSGIDVLHAIKKDERTRQIPVVVITSSAEERDRAESYTRGANSYVVKPIEFDAFTRTLTDVGFYWVAVNRPPERPR